MLSKIKKILFANLLLIGLFATAHFALAAGVDVGLDYGAGTGLATSDPRVVAANIIRIALAFLGIIAIGLMVFGGFLWMTAAGNEDQVDRAKKLLVSAVIGLLIILSSFAIASYVLNRLLEATGVATTGTGTTGGTIVPGSGGTGTPCDDNTLTPMCEPSATICDTSAGFFCSPSSCTCQAGGGLGASCDTDTTLLGCQAGFCLPGLFCDGATCTCEEGSGIGESCDSDILAAGCQISTSTCSNYLSCDGADCTCQDWPVVEWISPQGGFCSDELNKSCRNDTDCTLSASSVCNKSLPNAAPGNIITIGGRYFGDTPGTVYFWNGSDFTLAGVSPSTLNPDCDSNWRADQIIVVVPAGVVSGPVRIVRSDALSDDSNNEQGPMVSDLLINTIRKPGLCKLNPDSGALDVPVTYYGINFSAGSSAKFGNYSSSLPGKNSNFVSTLSVNANVPSISAGQTTTFVSGLSGDLSNYLRFNKIDEVDRGPYIISFEPETGAPGQYVTIYGSGFGASRGKSAVYFGDETGFLADYSFPDICADSVWSDNQIVVKVPTSAVDGNYALTLVVGSKVINTGTLSPAVFGINRSLPLLPSVCRISPSLGDVDVQVSLWGEYFDAKNTLSQVKFYNEKIVSNAGITFWDLDSEVKTGVKPYRVDTIVPPDTTTGLVRIVKGASALSGNGLNFRIGSCLEAENPDNACAPEVCCAAGTYKAGRCAASEADCFMDVPSSVYEWDFNTGSGSVVDDSGIIPNSCVEKSRIQALCDTTICPNSAGECSPYSNLTGGQTSVANCVYSCDGVGPCTSGSCVYNSVLDRCVSAGGITCSMPSVVKDAHGNNVDAYCQEYQGQSRRVIYIDTNDSCPNSWTKINVEVGGSGVLVCANLASTCTSCGGSFSCMDEGGDPAIGICSAPNDICPTDSSCQSDNKCKKTSTDECQCCCRKANVNEDCCFGLTCDGTCGGDRDTDTGTYGVCSGCRADANNDGLISGAEQTVSDGNCNCANSFGKFCDVDADPNKDGVPEGACNDCAALASNSSCTNHSTSCCVDATKKDLCTGLRFGVDVGNVFTPVVNAGVSYCGYFPCQNSNSSCNGVPEIGPFATSTRATPTTPAVPAVKYFKTQVDCSAKCSTPALAGLTCIGKAGTCDTSICSSPFACLMDASGATADCGVCCCNPASDQCGSIGPNPNMRCQPDMSPCSGANRGLCCGCAFNSDCVPGGTQPDTVGCGIDNCCRARLGVDKTAPLDGQVDVCTNAEIQATFNGKMDISSFSGNVIVAGEYITPCPDGTVYLASGNDGWQEKSTLAKTWIKVSGQAKRLVKKIFKPNALASEPPLIFMNYCAINGSVEGEHIDSEDGPTILKFRPAKILDSGRRKYFVIIKGDPALDNSAGVESFWNIGINIPVGAAANRVDNSYKFNGIAYPSSYIWSFTTRDDQGGNKGVCDIDKVVVTPSSYLFSKNVDDLNEDNVNPMAKTFDSVRDSDKKFTAKALSAEGEVLFSAPGYAWDWNWAIDEVAVASIFRNASNQPFAINDASQLIRASSDIVDNRTKARATVHLTDTTASSIGNGLGAVADIFVFLCDNPWPVIAADGTWRPWADNPYGMKCVTGNCMDMRYEMYYCRDDGSTGTADDLPVLSTSTNRGQISPTSEILKESYFFRQTPPTVESTNLQLIPIPRGGEVQLNWNEVRDPKGVETVSKYKIYYGSKSGAPYASSVEIPVDQAPYLQGRQPILIQELDKNKTYYFAITAVYSNGEESDYSNEQKVEPKDVQAPEKPTGVLSESPLTMIPVNISYEDIGWKSDGGEKVAASFSVNGSPDEVLKYVENFQLSYGTSPTSYSQTIAVPARKALVEGDKAIITTNFATGTPYYFSVVALKQDRTLLAGTGKFVLTFNEDGSFEIKDATSERTDSLSIPVPSGTMIVRWNPNTDDTVKYVLYVGTNHASYGATSTIFGRDAAQGETKKEYSTSFTNTQGQFFIAVSAVDAAGNESEKSDEIISIPSRSAYTFRNSLTNVSFEDGALGGVPTNWSAAVQPKASIGISGNQFFSGSKSLRFSQVPGIPWPGVCGTDLINRKSPEYDAYPAWGLPMPTFDGSICNFSNHTDCNSGGVCQAAAGSGLPWPYTNNVMWGKVVYNVSNLDWNVGEDYLLAFYYKGKLRSATSPILGYDLGWVTHCRGLFNGACSAYGGNWHVCPGDSNRCCDMPAQENCYDYVVMPGISAGDYDNGPYNGWYLYFETFTYTEGLSRLYDWSGRNHNEVGMSIGYNNTDDGTDFYIDDFIVAQRVKE